MTFLESMKQQKWTPLRDLFGNVVAWSHGGQSEGVKPYIIPHDDAVQYWIDEKTTPVPF